MSFTQTPNYNLYKPTINADNDQWGTHLNANADTLDAALVGVAAPANDSIGRNKLHNPLFNVQQRGTGPWTTNLAYMADRWQMEVSLDTASFGVYAASDAIRASVGDEATQFFLSNTFTGNAGAAAFNIAEQKIEKVPRLSNKTVIVSFWAAASAALKLGVSFDQIFGTGGSPSTAVALNGQSVSLAPTWTRYSVTIVLPSAAAKTFGTNGDDYTRLMFWFSSGATQNVRAGNIGVQSGTVQLWGVQLEIAQAGQTQPSPLEKPDPRYDLSNCQGFYSTIVNYQAWGTAGAAAQNFGNTWIFPVTMRGIPAIALSGQAYSNAAGLTSQNPSNYGVGIYAASSAAGAVWYQTTITASADL